MGLLSIVDAFIAAIGEDSRTSQHETWLIELIRNKLTLAPHNTAINSKYNINRKDIHRILLLISTTTKYYYVPVPYSCFEAFLLHRVSKSVFDIECRNFKFSLDH